MRKIIEKALIEIGKGRSLKRVITNVAEKAHNYRPDYPEGKIIALRYNVQASVDQHTGRKNVEAVFVKGELVDVRLI